MNAESPAASPQPVAVELALQGGGSHGAFTWGVLDRLLQDATIGFEGISGTSAGALNAAVLATGLARGGRDGARRALHDFWHHVAGQGNCFGALRPPLPGSFGFPFAGSLADYNLDRHPAWGWFSAWARAFSPYQLNPLNVEPLREVVRCHVDESALRSAPLQVFVTATAVHTGQPVVFSGRRLSIDALLASSCLPQVFQAVVIDGVPYWDGGYTGNPALWPLLYETPATDLILVQINPLQRPGTPDTAAEIADRVNEITFNAALVGEMRAIAFVKRLLAEHKLDPGRYKDPRLHCIADDDALAPLNASSKFNTELGFLQRLHALGHDAAERWLTLHRADLGVRSTLDVEAAFLRRRG